MKLYFNPLACSLASRITVYEAGIPTELVEVDRAKHASDGTDFRTVNPLGLVPTLRLDDGELLTENAAILQYLADLVPGKQLAPEAGSLARTRLHQWLCFIGTELHKSLFAPLLDKTAAPDVKAYALEDLDSRLGHVANHLATLD